MSRFTLDLEVDYPYILLGINTSLKGYRLAWNLNTALGIDLQRAPSLEAYVAKNEREDFIFFSTFVEDQKIHYRLVENRTGAHLFIPEHPRADYLLLVDTSPELQAEVLIAGIRQINTVSAVFEIDIQRLKSKQNLLLTT